MSAATSVASSSESADFFAPAAVDNGPGQGVGLSDPDRSRRSRELLDLANRLSNTGYLNLWDLSILAEIDYFLLAFKQILTSPKSQLLALKVQESLRSSNPSLGSLYPEHLALAHGEIFNVIYGF
jgi:hypothetical protein